MRQLFVLLALTCSASCWSAAVGSVCPDTVKITVVYNCLIWPDQDWQLVIREQLQHLVGVGLAECAKIHVVMGIPSTHPEHSYERLESFLAEGRQLVASILPQRISPHTGGTVVSQLHENSFEYSGLHLVWLLAQEVPLSDAGHVLFLYFHSKGMVHHGRLTARLTEEMVLFNATIAPWRALMESFGSDPHINRAGMYPSESGWIWGNFWWARASYLKLLVQPIRTPRRHYYEDWLGRLYDATTEQSAEPGRHYNCSACLSIAGPWTPGLVFPLQNVPRGFSPTQHTSYQPDS